MGHVQLTMEEYEALRAAAVGNYTEVSPSTPPPKKKKKRVSKYSKEFGRQIKKLQKKHPRTKITKLMKRAHAATKKALK